MKWFSKSPPSQEDRFHEIMYGWRERNEEDTVKDLQFKSYDIPRKPFGDRQFVTIPDSYPRPKRKHGYHFWSAQWVVPVDSDEDALSVWQEAKAA